jgi:hypothetical protein
VEVETTDNVDLNMAHLTVLKRPQTLVVGSEKQQVTRHDGHYLAEVLKTLRQRMGYVADAVVLAWLTID